MVASNSMLACSYPMGWEDVSSWEHLKCYWSSGDASLWHRVIIRPKWTNQKIGWWLKLTSKSTQFNIQMSWFDHSKDHLIRQKFHYLRQENRDTPHTNLALHRHFFPVFGNSTFGMHAIFFFSSPMAFREHIGDTHQRLYDILRHLSHEGMAFFVFCGHMLWIKIRRSAKPRQDSLLRTFVCRFLENQSTIHTHNQYYSMKSFLP